jgi:formylmethanofuran dehydrogenase subunit E
MKPAIKKMKTAIEPIPKRNLTPPGDQESIASIKNEVLSAEHETPSSICDLCGDLTPINQLQNTSGNAQLCPACYMQFISIPQAFRKCFERILLGNVC